MTLDYKKPVPDGSHAWCSDCDWKHRGTQSHIEARTHHQDHQHLVHLYTPEENL